ncbi:MAG: hypothetical protein KDA88_12840 [Planctomycetaceae bacterium]|nr:hypothetical protein [Planctomycetaceae bacterium]MCA9031671.1 hypothetical protein [Planctomycetaceae bacterium]MCB9951806.1 hypothetical protein [Planctomycetaceae bacterium]
MSKAADEKGQLICRVYRGVSKWAIYFVALVLGFVALAMLAIGISMVISPLASERTGGFVALGGFVIVLLGAVYLYVSALPDASNLVKFFETGVEYAVKESEAKFTRYEKLAVFSAGMVDRSKLEQALALAGGGNNFVRSLQKIPAIKLMRSGEDDVVVIMPTEGQMTKVAAAAAARRGQKPTKKVRTRPKE